MSENDPPPVPVPDYRPVEQSGYAEVAVSILGLFRGAHPRETLWGPTPTAASASLRSTPLFTSP